MKPSGNEPVPVEIKAAAAPDFLHFAQ